MTPNGSPTLPFAGALSRWAARLPVVALPLVALAWAGPVRSQPSVPEPARVVLPAAGSGPLLVLFTGADGAPNHILQAEAFGREGYVVAVIESQQLPERGAAEVKEVITRALALPQVRSRRAAVVGYSLGGWLVLAFANRLPDLVATAVAYYPSTYRAGEPKAFLASPPVAASTLILAGVRDTYMNCCTIDRARALVAAAALPDVRAPLQLVEFPEADHGFVLPAFPQVHRPADEADAFKRALVHLRHGGG